MRSIRKSGITALTAAIALSLGAVPVALTVPAIVAGGEGTTTLTPGAIDAGQLVLTTTTAKGTVTYNGLQQEFSGGQQCAITPIGDPAGLLKITGSIGGVELEGAAGFRDGDIGVFEASAPSSSPNNASQCFRVDAGSFTETESLTFAIDPDGDMSDAPFAETLSADLATVDARAKSQSGKIKVEFLDPSNAPIPVADSPYSLEIPWGPKAKSGAPILVDSAKVAIPLALPDSALFSGVRLTALAGSFSVRGATLDIVSQADEIFCNPGNPTGGASTTSDAGTTTVNYLGNADESDSCFGVKLTGGNREYQWLKPLTVSQDAQFVFDQTWTIDPAPTVPDYELNKAYINFELKLPVLDANGDPTVGEDGKPVTVDSEDNELEFCPSWLYPSGNPALELALITADATYQLADGTSQKVLDRLAAEDMQPDVAGVDGSQGTQFACIDKKTRSTRFEIGTGNGGVDVMKVTDKIFLIGDANVRYN